MLRKIALGSIMLVLVPLMFMLIVLFRLSWWLMTPLLTVPERKALESTRQKASAMLGELSGHYNQILAAEYGDLTQGTFRAMAKRVIWSKKA